MKMAQTIINVEGMSCEHCVKAVTEATGALPGVENVSVDLTGGKVALEYDPVQSTIEEIKNAIEDQGFDVVG
jgi:copper chaperone